MKKDSNYPRLLGPLAGLVLGAYLGWWWNEKQNATLSIAAFALIGAIAGTLLMVFDSTEKEPDPGNETEIDASPNQPNAKSENAENSNDPWSEIQLAGGMGGRRPDSRSKYSSVISPGFRRVLAILSLPMIMFPVLGPIYSLIALFINRREPIWSRMVAFVSLLASSFLTWKILNQPHS